MRPCETSASKAEWIEHANRLPDKRCVGQHEDDPEAGWLDPDRSLLVIVSTVLIFRMLILDEGGDGSDLKCIPDRALLSCQPRGSTASGTSTM